MFMLPDGTILLNGKGSGRKVTSSLRHTVRSPRTVAGMTEVNGEEQVDTGLTYGIQAVALSIMASNLSPDGESKVSWYQLEPSAHPERFIIRVEKSGTNEGLLGDNPVMVSWIAWEK